MTTIILGQLLPIFIFLPFSTRGVLLAAVDISKAVLLVAVCEVTSVQEKKMKKYAFKIVSIVFIGCFKF